MWASTLFSPRRTSPTGAYPTPVTSYSWLTVHRWFTVISFCVSVPVLSVQMTEVEPRVSTELSFFTSAFLLLMRCTAMASESVTVGSSPSGMKATTMPSEKMNAAANSLPTNIWSSRKKPTPMHAAKMVICLVVRLSCSCSGLWTSSMFCVRWAILPNSVSMPMRVTTARPFPSETEVPAKMRLGVSAWVRSSSSTASAVLRTGLDSPVSVDWFTCRSEARTTRASAEILSPSASTMTSPGTRSSARIFCSCPSRMTLA